MTHSNLGDLCQQPALKASTAKYSQLVYDSTNELHEPVQCILSALDRRVMGLAKSVNFDAALRDAHLMQQLSTFSPLGYLRAAEVYREQGKQSQVIDVCSKGLDVVDTNDPHYATLLQLKTDAEQHQSSCIDFISKLPIDLVKTTLIPMFMDDEPLDTLRPCPYLYVSTLWRDRIIQCFGGLRFRTGTDENEYDEEDWEITKFARHTKEIEVPYYSQATWLAYLFLDNNFCMLQKFKLIGLVDTYIAGLRLALKTISKTLTHLNVHMDSGIMLSVPEIVSLCPNLVSLCVFNPIDADFSSLQEKKWRKLKRLSLYQVEQVVTPDMVLAISQRFPSLNQLELGPWQDLESALTIASCYPRMNSLTLTVDGSYTEVGYSNQGKGRKGVTDISVVQQYDGEETCHSMSPMLKQHHTTIENMSWAIEPDSGDTHLYDIQYPRLKKLTLTKSGGWLPGNAPKLEELKITAASISTSPSVLDTIPPKLKKLEIDLGIGRAIDDMTPVVRYLRRFARHPHLKDLAIYLRKSDDMDPMLDAIAGLGRLQRLMISFPDDMDPSQMQQVFETLANGCPDLSCLEVKCDHTPTTFIMDAINRLEHLQYIAIAVDHWRGTVVVDASFWEAVKRFSQLKTIRVNRKVATNMDDIRRLKEQRPDLDVFVDKSFTDL